MLEVGDEVFICESYFYDNYVGELDTETKTLYLETGVVSAVSSDSNRFFEVWFPSLSNGYLFFERELIKIEDDNV